MRLLAFIVCLPILITSCKSSKKGAEINNTPFYEVAFMDKWDKAEQDRRFDFKHNEAKSMVLCTRSSSNSPSTFDYSVFDLDSKKEIYESGFIGTKIYWINNQELAIEGVSRVDNKKIIINVLSDKQD